MVDHAGYPDPAPAAPPLVGREREQAILRDALDSALAGRGALVLISGEAGIGKTALAEATLAEATAHGALILVGRCYDLSETPPYGPWTEALERAPSGGGLPALPAAMLPTREAEPLGSQDAVARRVVAYLAALAATRPLVLLLDDLHWADPASLDLLRFLARGLGEAPTLLLATYRSDELTRRHLLAPLLPLLVREARAARLDLRPLDEGAIGALVAARYALSATDTSRVVPYLAARTEGNALFLGELLRTLEQEGALRRAGDAWALGDPERVPVPALLRQVIEGRVARLEEETGRLLAVAAVIGQAVPLALWAAVGDVAEDALLGHAERALGARLLAETPDGAGVRFAHALIREALYEGTASMRRRVLHRRVGEALAAGAATDPDAVASHFQRAGDPRAAEWLVRAGLRAHRAAAWLTAVARFTAAATRLENAPGRERERGWLLYLSGALLRYSDNAEAIRLLDGAKRAGLAAGDRALAAFAGYQRGIARCMQGLVRLGVGEMERGVAALDLLPADFHRWSGDELAMATIESLFPATAGTAPAPFPPPTVSPGQATQRGVLINWLGQAGHYREARAMGEGFVAVMASALGDAHLRSNGCIYGYLGLGHAHAALGLADARRMFAVARAQLAALGNAYMVEYALWAELLLVALPYAADDRAGRAAQGVAAARAWEQAAQGITSAAHPSLTGLLLALPEGRWAEARRLAEAGRGSPHGHLFQCASVALAALARHRGEPAAAWARVAELHPAGPDTAPGDCHFPHGSALQALAADLALDAGDLAAADHWIAAHARWLEWSGAILWQAEHRLLRARHARLSGDPAAALMHAETALAHAKEPRQPLALLAAHRLIGELATDAGHHAAAQDHLDAALALADACAAPYERALTLLARAELRAATGDRDATLAALAEARALLEPLGAAPALARADALAAHLATPAAPPTVPFGLSAREVEVLRLVAGGLSDAQVAERLFLSPFTVKAHLRSVYTKTGAENRTAASRLATEHNLA